MNNKIKLLSLQNQQDLPVIDWALGLKLAGNKRDLAEQLLHLFAASLADEVATLMQLNTDQQYDQLLQRLHKLHGAVCYCGAPRLKNMISTLEFALKNNIMNDLSALLMQLQSESDLLLDALRARRKT